MYEKLRRTTARQLGCFTGAQARAAGVDERVIERLVRRGMWEEIEPGVFRAAPGGRMSWQQRLMALVLSVDGVAYGRSAAALYGLLTPPKSPEVLVARTARNRLRPGLHSTRHLPTSDTAIACGIRATMPARTVVDACASLPPKQVVGLVDRVVVRKLTRASTLRRCAMELQNSKRPGCRRVLAALESQHPDLDRARNDWEAALVRLVAEAGFPAPVPNHPVVVAGQRRFLDLAWPDVSLDLEFDGFSEHMVRSVFDDDRVRQNALVAAGWTVFRVTSRMLEDDPRAVLDTVAGAIEGRGHEFRQMCRIA